MSNKKGILGLTPTCVGGLVLLHSIQFQILALIWNKATKSIGDRDELAARREIQTFCSFRSDFPFILPAITASKAICKRFSQTVYVAVWGTGVVALNDIHALLRTLLWNPSSRRLRVGPRERRSERCFHVIIPRILWSGEACVLFNFSGGGFSVKWYWLYLLSLCKLTYDRECRVDLMSI